MSALHIYSLVFIIISMTINTLALIFKRDITDKIAAMLALGLYTPVLIYLLP